MDNNGWPGKPGVPLNPERDGWHWFVRGDFYSLALWHRGHFTFQDTTAWPEEFSQLDMAYVGPCLTPAEMEARVKEARRHALEEAALRLEELHKNHKYNPKTGEGSEHDVGYYCALSEGAAWIRALKGEGDD
jgi:hypothetical protein